VKTELKLLLIATWAFVSNLILWQLPLDTESQGFIAGMILSASGFIVTVAGYVMMKRRGLGSQN